MGEIGNSAKINEAVNLLHAFAPKKLEDLASALPAIRTELTPGILAGERPEDADENWDYNFEKAQLIIEAATLAQQLGKNCTSRLREKIVKTNRAKIAVQFFSLASSTSVVGLLLADQSLTAKVTAVATTVISFVGLILEQRSKLITGTGSIYETYQKLNSHLLNLATQSGNLGLMLKYRRPTSELSAAITAANGTLESINLILPEIP